MLVVTATSDHMSTLCLDSGNFILIYFLLKIYADKKGDYAVKVSGVEISPNPVVRGKPATFKISAATGEFTLSVSDVTAKG